MEPVPDGALADVLMVTHRRPAYLRRTLPRLLDGVDDRCRVWLWHNGDDEETLEVVRAHLDHPRLHRFHHSRENVRLVPPTNWLWQESDGGLLGKVDDDCLLEDGWTTRLRAAHRDHPFGVLGCWRFRPEDYRPDLAQRKLARFPGGHEVLQNLWVQGSGYLVPRAAVQACGPLAASDSFTRFCVRVAATGRVNGWLVPFVQEEHLDDPRSPESPLRTDEDLRANLPLSAQAHGITTLADWTAQMRRSALVVQSASLDARRLSGWRAKRAGAVRRVQRVLTGRSTW